MPASLADLDGVPGPHGLVRTGSSARAGLVHITQVSQDSKASRPSQPPQTLERRATARSNRIGEKVAAGGISVYSDPGEPGFEVAPFAEAVESSSLSWACRARTGVQTSTACRAPHGLVRAGHPGPRA